MSEQSSESDLRDFGITDERLVRCIANYVRSRVQFGLVLGIVIGAALSLAAWSCI